MGKVSQLSQLKSALAQSRSHQVGKKRKRGSAPDTEKDKTINEVHQKINPFDVKVTKLKHDVGGRKIKGVTGLPARSKQAGLDQRKKTLLKEYEEKGHAGGIVDRRFGENDPTMTPEERMLERFIKERSRTSKGAAFNLEDEDELTHYGQSLSNLDDFGDIGLNLDDEEDYSGEVEIEDEIDGDQPARKKSKSEVMAEVMAKSKEHKFLRQMEREKGDNIRRELDQEFDSVRGLLYSGDPSSEDNIVPEATGRDENYDQLVRELAFDRRAIPKDRTKTEEELASEAKEALENAERRRRERMIGEDEGEEEDGILGPGLGGGSDVDGEDSDYEGEQPEDPVAATRMKDRVSKMSSKELIAFAESFIKRLVLMHKSLKRGLAQGALNKTTNTWPGLADLQFLQSIGMIWSTSDLNHRVVSPTRILMGAYLALGRVRSLGDIACGLFLCTLFLQFETLSKRLVPEAVNFLGNTILHLAPHGFRDPTSIPGSFPSPDFRSDLCRPLSIDVKKSRDLPAHKPNIAAILSRGDPDEQTKVDLLGLSLDLLVRFADMYKSLEGFLELFEPLSAVLHNIHTKKLSPSLQTSTTKSLDLIDRLIKFSKEARQPLGLQYHKPIPIPTYIPKFEVSSSSYLRSRDPDYERNEASKLRKQVKEERKGAIRELRKDARFLTAVQQKKQAQKDMEYNIRMKRILGSLESERAEEKAMEREKGRLKKRRAGGK